MRQVLRQVLFVFVLLVAFAIPVLAQEAGFAIAPYLQNITPDGATVMWETPEPSVGVVQYGLEGKFDREAKEDKEAKIHRVRLTGLEADTTYSYRVRAGDAEAASTFKAAPTLERPMTFVLMGDSRRWEKRFEETGMAAHMLQWQPELFLNVGDLVVQGHDYSLWPDHFSRFSELGRHYMLVTARGNHEGSAYNDVENDWFAKYHELPDGGEPFTAFDWGNTHFVLIAYERMTQAAPWLDKHLEEVKRKYVVVAMHFPVYCTGYLSATDSRKDEAKLLEELRKVLDKHGVALHLSGHTHIYERVYALRDGKRDDRNGTSYIINGGDIGANYPEWWTAVADDHATMAKPTYTVFQCKDDRIEMRTFCWSSVENRIIQIDYYIIWKDEAVPKAVLASLAGLKGEALAKAVDETGAMVYAPAARAVLPYLAGNDEAVRRAAARAIRATGAEEVAEELAPYLGDKDVAVRREIARALEIAMPEKLAPEVVKQVEEAAQDTPTRVALMGALQLHAPAKTTAKVAFAVLKKDDGPAEVRRRAAYALDRVVEKKDLRTLTDLFEQERDTWVMLRLAYTLNELTGERQRVDDKGPLATSEPGKRGEFVEIWMKAGER